MRLPRSVCLDTFTGLPFSFFALFAPLRWKKKASISPQRREERKRRRMVQTETKDTNDRPRSHEKRSFKSVCEGECSETLRRLRNAVDFRSRSPFRLVTQTEHFQGREFHRQGAKNAKRHKEIKKMAISKSSQHNGH